MPPGADRRSTLLWVLLALLGVAGTTLGLLYWLEPPRMPAVLPVVVTGGPTAWLEQDRAALADSGFLGRPLDDWAANPHRDQIRLRFQALAKVRRTQPVVAYLAAPAAVDTAGGVTLLPADRIGDHPRNRLPLADLLASFRDCPARHRLLILDLVPAANDPSPGDLSAAVFRELEAVQDAGRLCLVACGPGQVPAASPEIGRTVFGHHLEAGLRGTADGWDGEGRDGRVTVAEVAAFVRSRVGEWTTTTRGTAQTPVLLGTAPDFFLRGAAGSPVVDEISVNEIAFPDWLRAGWERHDRWRADGRAASAPWAFHKVRAALFAAERNLLAGQSAGEVLRALDANLAAADKLAVSLTAGPTPDSLPTLAAVYPNYVLPDAATLAELRAAARQFDTRPVAAPPAAGEKPAPEPAVPPEFEPFRAKPHPVVAAAVFLVLAEDPAPTAARVRGLAKLLAAQSPTPRYAETVLIRRLGDLAGQSPLVPWSGENAAFAVQAARLLEDAVARPEVHAWAAPALDHAYRLRADAEAALFSPGYAPPEEANRRLHDAEVAARIVKENADRLRAALAAREDAVQTLTGITPLVNSGAIPLPVAERLADAARQLGEALTPPAEPLDAAALAARVGAWDRDAAAVRASLAEVVGPYRGEGLAKIRTGAAAHDAGPAVVAELDVLLATPLFTAAERADLWNLRAAINRRLTAEVVRRDATTDEAVRRRLASPPVVNPREPAAPVAADAEAATRRAKWADVLRQAAGTAEPAVLDSPATNPVAVTTRDRVRRMWQWVAARFDYESRDPVTDVNDRAFTTTAARACAAVTAVPPDRGLEVTPAAIPKLTPDRPTVNLELNLRAVGGDRTPVRVSTLSPADAWVTVGKAAEVELDPLRQARAAVTLSAGDSPVSFPTARGVLVEAESGGRTYHRRVPVQVDEITDRLVLMTRAAAGQVPALAREIRVRPNGTPQPYQLLLANPTPKDRKVFVRLPGLNRETGEVTVPAGKTAALLFPAPPVPPTPPGLAPQPGQQPPPDEGLSLPGDELVLHIFDADDRDKIRQTIRVPAAVTNPADYLRVTDPVFLPAAGAKPNRLNVTVVPGDVPGVGPVGVRLGFPADRNPGLVLRDGSLTGSVTRAGPPVTVYADNLALPNPAGAEVWVTVSADGAERVFTYSAFLPSLGETVRLTPVGRPMVRVKVDPVATGTAPLPVTLEVDNAPPGAKLELLVGTATDAKSPVTADLTLPIPTAKDAAARVKFDLKGETLLLAGVFRDHEPKLPVELLVGRRVLEARLLDRDGKELASHRADVTFDGTPPQNVRFLDLPPKARKDQPLAVRATCDPTVSGIKEVKFFLGPPQKNAPPQNPPPVAGKPTADPKANEWRAALPVEGQKGVVTVGVQFVTHSGLSAIATQDVELADAAELNKPEPGKIAGKLVENRLPQPGADVFLYDAKGTAIAKATTKPDGTFEFKDLVPAAYFLFSQKEVTNRQVKQEVAVKPGETAAVTLELLLK